ncbi:hypothetical protein BD414DRAFT_508040 [Trametes punicea]|nr:hypothetical protein BD414DRAFT_508040 [Trametes punicea]
MRTRPGLKSCLKITPPITPDFSATSSPCGSGRTSPSLMSDGGSSTGSGGRKTVSFCSEDELEEVFWVDEWDRTPAAVTPKLSYQDILELKQLRISLPYSPPPPTSRQPFTTSPPPSSSAGPSNKPPFPVSRFATGPSHTPSKWKNRSEPQRSDVDPEILPYLDAVPIRLLPLLPQSPPSETPSSDPPDPHPQTPTPTASPERRPAPPPPSEPPEIRIEPPSQASSPCSPLRKQNFAFVPLLPVQDPPPALPPTVSTQSNPVRPKKFFNMTFLPVNAIPEGQPVIPTHATSDPSVEVSSVGMMASSSVSGSDPESSDASQLAPPSPSSLSSTLTPTTSTSQPPSDMSPPPLSLSLPSVQSSASESDNDTETDTTDTYISDTDAESDAPSTSTLGSSLPSPPLEDNVDVEARLEQIKLGTSELGFDPASHISRVRTLDAGSYFPPLPLSGTAPLPVPTPAHPDVMDAPPALPSGPGQTPPLSVLYPSPTSQHQSLMPSDIMSSSVSVSASAPPRNSSPESAGEDVDLPSVPVVAAFPVSLADQGEDGLPATPLSLKQVLKKKLTLEALPSPALVPPSPFELEPSDTVDASPTAAQSNAREVGAALASAALEADELSVSAHQVMERLAALNLSRGPDETPLVRVRSRSVADTPKESPLLTSESMREAWDAHARVGLGVGVDLGVKASLLSPSIGRRRSS